MSIEIAPLIMVRSLWSWLAVSSSWFLWDTVPEFGLLALISVLCVLVDVVAGGLLLRHQIFHPGQVRVQQLTKNLQLSVRISDSRV